MKKKSILWMNLLLVFALTAGLVLPTVNVNAASKSKKKKVLIVYFSATGNTKSAAKKIKKATGGTLYRIKAAQPYTEADLNYNDDNCRANIEQEDGSVRPKINGKVKNISKYDVIFIGYPIWWSKEPMIIRTFLESYDLTGKKVVPFCTSGGSGISGSMKGVKAAARGAKVQKGKDLTDMSYKGVKKWAEKIINTEDNSTNNQNNSMDETSMTLKVNDKEIEIIIYDTEVGKDISGRLPYKAKVSNSGIDLCGDAGKGIKFSDTELTRKSNAGDIMYIKNGNYFSIFLTDYNNQNDAYKIGKIKNKEDTEYLKNNTSTVTIEIIKNTNGEETGMGNNEFSKTINTEINANIYTLKPEDNDTAKKLVTMLPVELNMTELNGNEKYYYLDGTLPSDSKNPGRIEKGDVMLYGNNCLVVFYKSFNTSYSYTKIGHIDNLPDLGKGNIKVKFSK